MFGLGLAVVNGFCRVPQGLVARRLPELPRRPYDLLRRRGGPEGGAVEALRRELAASANAWRRGGATRRVSA